MYKNSQAKLKVGRKVSQGITVNKGAVFLPNKEQEQRGNEMMRETFKTDLVIV